MSWGNFPTSLDSPSKVQRFLRATSCCCPFAGDTSARGCRAALAAKRGSLRQWGQPPRNRRMTPTRRAHGAGVLCGHWLARPGRTDGRPTDRGAPRPLVKKKRKKSVYSCMCVFVLIMYSILLDKKQIDDIKKISTVRQSRAWTHPREWSRPLPALGRRESLCWETLWCISPPSPSGTGWRAPTSLLPHSDLHRGRGRRCYYELCKSVLPLGFADQTTAQWAGWWMDKFGRGR